MADINIGEITEALTGKLDIDCINADHNTTPAGLNSNQIRTVITTYVSGTSGYRIWSDGYCEQWGQIGAGMSGTVTLTKTYSNTDYIINMTPYQDSNNVTFNAGIVSKTINSFVYRSERTIEWKASGYLASGQY